MKKIIIVLLAVVSLNSCMDLKQEPLLEEKPIVEEALVPEQVLNPFTQSIERAHNKTAFLKEDAVRYDFTVSFGGNTMFDGKITQKTDGSMIRMDNKDGGVIVCDGQKVFANTAELATDPMSRFHIFTWSYFFCYAL